MWSSSKILTHTSSEFLTSTSSGRAKHISLSVTEPCAHETTEKRGSFEFYFFEKRQSITGMLAFVAARRGARKLPCTVMYYIVLYYTVRLILTFYLSGWVTVVGGPVGTECGLYTKVATALQLTYCTALLSACLCGATSCLFLCGIALACVPAFIQNQGTPRLGESQVSGGSSCDGKCHSRPRAPEGSRRSARLHGQLHIHEA